MAGAGGDGVHEIDNEEQKDLEMISSPSSSAAAETSVDGIGELKEIDILSILGEDQYFEDPLDGYMYYLDKQLKAERARLESLVSNDESEVQTSVMKKFPTAQAVINTFVRLKVADGGNKSSAEIEKTLFAKFPDSLPQYNQHKLITQIFNEIERLVHQDKSDHNEIMELVAFKHPEASRELIGVLVQHAHGHDDELDSDDDDDDDENLSLDSNGDDNSLADILNGLDDLSDDEEYDEELHALLAELVDEL